MSFVRDKLLLLILQHIKKIRLLLFIVGLCWILYWPKISRRTYLSENALTPTIATTKFSIDNARQAIKLSNTFCNTVQIDGKQAGMDFLYSTLKSFAFDTYPLHHFSQQRNYVNETITVTGTNLYATLRSPRGFGKESIVFAVPFDRNKCENMGFALSLMQYLSQRKWINLDIIFVVADVTNVAYDSTYFHWAPFQAFIDDKTIPTGIIREAIVLDIAHFSSSSIAVHIDGVNGALPNLDMLNALVRVADSEGVTVTLSRANSHPLINRFFARHLKLVLPEVDRYAALARFFVNQIIGMPTGAHAWFRQHLIHSFTITEANSATNQRSAVTQHQSQIENNIRQIGKVCEGLTRSLNNLQEALHQSFFLYFLDSVRTFIGFEDFLVPVWILLSPCILEAVSAYYDAQREQSTKTAASKNHFLIALSTVAVSLLAGTVIHAIPWLMRSAVEYSLAPISILKPQMFSQLWFFSAVTIVITTLLIGFPIAESIAKVLTQSTTTTTTATQSEASTSTAKANDSNAFSSEANDASLRTALLMKCFALVHASLALAVLSILQTALCIVLSVYIFILSLVTTITATAPTLKGKVGKAARLLLAGTLCAPLVIVFLLVVGQQQQQTAHWMTGVALPMQLVDFYSNVLYVVLCIVCIPVHMTSLRALFAS